MAKKFNQDDLYQDDIYRDLRESLEKTLATLKIADDGFKEFHDDINKMAQDLGKSAKEVRDLNKANAESKTILEEKSKVQKQIEKVEEQLTKVTKQEREQLAGLRLEQQKANKEAKLAAKINKGLETEYQKQSRQLNDLRNQYKNLVLAKGGATKESKKLLKEITALDKQLKQVDKDVGQSQRSVGAYENALGGLKNTLGQLGLAFGAFAIAKDIFNITKEFEESLASLSAITGVTGEAFEAFKQGVVDVAGDTKKSATEVAQAFEIVGSAKPELLANADALAAVTKQAIILSQATRLDLETTSRSLTGTLNQFNLEAGESERVINALAAGSQAGAAPVNLISESLDKFGTVAATLNIGVEESIGLIETLAEKNITGAEAGTQLRNVLTILATAETLPPKALEALEQYGVNTKLVSDTSVDLSVRLAELGKIQDDVNALNAVFGKSNLVAAQTLLQNQDAVIGYTDAVTGTSTATEQAAIQQDTLSAIIEQLKAAWESVVLQFTEGTGSLDILKAVLRFVANNLETLIKIVINAIAVIGSYKIAVNAANVATKVLGNVSEKTSKKIAKSFGAVGIAVAAVVILVTELIAAYQDATDAGDALEQIQEKINEQVAEETDKLKVLGVQLLATNTASEERQKLLDEINAEYGTTLENLEDETAFVQQLAAAYEEVVRQLEKKISARVIEEELVEALKTVRQLDKQIAEEGTSGLTGQLLVKTREEGQKLIDSLKAELADLQTEGLVDNAPPSDLPPDAGDSNAGGGSGGKDKDPEKERLKQLSKFRAEQLRERQKLEADLIAAGVPREIIEEELFRQRRSQYNDEINFIKDLGLTTQDELLKTTLAAEKFRDKGFFIDELDLKKIEEEGDKAGTTFGDSFGSALSGALLKANEQIAKDRKKRQEEFKKSVQETVDLIKEVTKFIEQDIDKRIEARQKEVKASQTEQARLSELVKEGNTDAAEALVAEKQKEAREKAAIEKLEKKKRNLLIIVTGLERANQLIQAGDGNPFKNAGSQLSEFLNGLPQLYEGTSGTVAEQFGAPHLNTARDNYLARLHGNEHVIGSETSSELHRAGFRTTDEIARAAMMYQSQALQRPVQITANRQNENRALIRSIQENTEAVKKIEVVQQHIEVVQQHIDFVQGVEVIRKGNTVTKNKYKGGGLRFE